MRSKFILSIIISLLLTFCAFAGDPEAIGKDKVKYLGDLVIEADEIIHGDVVVMQGDLRIMGTVTGNAVVSFGDVLIDSGAVIHGDVVALRGKITVDEYAEITGEVVESRLFDISLDEPSWNSKWDSDDDYDDEDEEKCSDADLDARMAYNKVDGFFLGMMVPKVLHHHFLPKITFHGYGGYGFSNDRWQYYAEADKWFFEDNILEFGVEMHDLTDTDDNWIIENEENSLAAFFIHEDFRDYFYRRGFGAHIGQTFEDFLKLKIKYLADNYSMTENNTNWALFGGNKDFRENFSFIGPDANIWPGMMRSLTASAEMKMLDGDLIMSASSEYAGYELEGDFEFMRHIFETKGYFLLGRHEGLDFRLRLGTSQDDLPPQKFFTLGGISTLRGFGHKEFYGKHLALLNVEYRLFSKRKPSKLWFLKMFQVGLFTDIGSTHPDIFSDFDTDYYHSDVGFSLMDDSGSTRVDIARRTDTGEKPWVITLRMNHPF